jgi:integrase/recombinase XerD
MPHGTDEAMGYNPFDAAQSLKKEAIRNIDSSSKPQHPMPVEELGHKIRNIKNILHTAVVTSQFKYGLRGGQVCAIKIPDVNIHHSGLKDLYPNLGTHHRVSDFDHDVIYFPTREEQPGVKSERPTVMPIGTETKKVLIKYLRQRPPVDEPWLFLSNSTAQKLDTDKINKYMWKPVFHPEYEETDRFQSVTSHYARHRFSTYWRKEIGINPELVKYMRGDKQKELENKPDVLDNYIHTYYEDVKDKYLSNVYRFNL